MEIKMVVICLVAIMMLLQYRKNLIRVAILDIHPKLVICSANQNKKDNMNVGLSQKIETEQASRNQQEIYLLLMETC